MSESAKPSVEYGDFLVVDAYHAGQWFEVLGQQAVATTRVLVEQGQIPVMGKVRLSWKLEVLAS